MNGVIRLALCALASVVCAAASAAPVSFANVGNGLYNTGVGVSGNADTHWLVNGKPATLATTSLPSTWVPTLPHVPAPGEPAAAALTPAGAVSTWVQANMAGTSPQTVPAGEYLFTTTFDLTGFDPDTAELVYRLSADNWLSAVSLNGVELRDSYGFQANFQPTGWETYRDWSRNYSIKTGFQPGVNTLSFLVINDPLDMRTGLDIPGFNPTGLRFEVLSATAERQVQAASTPEPLSVVLVAGGVLAAVGVGRLRRRK